MSRVRDIKIKNLIFNKEKKGFFFSKSYVIYTWKFKLDNVNRIITLAHSKMKGKRVITLDNKQICLFRKYTYNFSYEFPIDTHTISINQINEGYILKIDGMNFQKLVNQEKLQKFSILRNEYIKEHPVIANQPPMEMNQFELANHIKIGVIGMGYVGLPLARLFSTKFKTIGYDLNSKRVGELMTGTDSTLEVPDTLLQEAINKHGFLCTTNIELIKDCNVYIVAVPTPVDKDNRPDLTPLKSASETIGKIIKKGDVVVYESTVYPGMTEEVCIPVIERVSGLIFNTDFFAGYSPERINPGDKEHTVEKIKKVTSGSTPETADFVDALYNSVLVNGTHKAPSIKVAEASKIIENAQRDVNIAFMNELSKIFNAMNIDTRDVLDAAASKWNFIKLTPGLVGGHCISVDPYYLIQKAQVYGVMPRIMMSSRRLNESMGEYVAFQTIKLMNKKGVVVKNAKILILGITFKENCPDIRNTKIVDIFNSLKEYTDNIIVCDPRADAEKVSKEYGINIVSDIEKVICYKYDAIILAVAHNEFKNLAIRSYLKNDNCVIYDVKGILKREDADGRL